MSFPRRRTDEERAAYIEGFLAAADDPPSGACVALFRNELAELRGPSPEDAAALAILEALGEEFAGEAIPYVWTHPNGFWGLPVLTVGLLTEEDRWIFTRVTRIFALDAVNPGAIAAEDLRRAFNSRHGVDTLA